MKRIIPFLIFSVMISTGNAQVIKSGKGKSVYVRVEDTASVKPFALKKYEHIQLNLFDLIFTNLSLSYEHISRDGMKGFQIPVSINTGGLPDTSDYYQMGSTVGKFLSQRNRIFQTGINYSFYFNGQDRVAPYMGVGLNAGWFYYWKYNYDTLYYNQYYMLKYKDNEKKIANNYAGILYAGILFNPRETVTFNLRGGFGLRRYGTDRREYTVAYGEINVSLGFKF